MFRKTLDRNEMKGMEINMEKKMYSIGEFAKLTSVTERTLRYYDKKELLKPTVRNEHGHRFYTEKDLISLQQILAMKYVDYSLEDIGEFLHKSGEDLTLSLDIQSNLLQKKKTQLEQILRTIEHVKNIIKDQEALMDRDLILALIYSLQSEQEMKEWMAEHVSQPLVDLMFMEGQSAQERIEEEKQMIGIFSDIKKFYNEGRSVDDKFVQKKVMELMTLLSNTFKPENLAELEVLAGAIDDVQHLHSSPIPKEVEQYLTEILESMENNTFGGDTID